MYQDKIQKHWIDKDELLLICIKVYLWVHLWASQVESLLGFYMTISNVNTYIGYSHYWIEIPQSPFFLLLWDQVTEMLNPESKQKMIEFGCNSRKQKTTANI